MGGAVWFKTHKLAMIATLVLSVLGMVPVLIDRTLEPIKRLEYHPMVGLATIAICLCQNHPGFFRHLQGFRHLDSRSWKASDTWHTWEIFEALYT